MADQYTHNFVFSTSDGGKFLKGECEFNTDNKLSFKFNSFSEPISEDTIGLFTEFMGLCHKIFNSEEGIVKLSINKKE